jgi:hypothetical protein
MIKLTYLREEDYWLFPVSIFSILGIVGMIYASVLMFRLPAALVGLGLLWFSANEIKKGYSKQRAWMHIGICLGISIVLFLGFYSLTN